MKKIILGLLALTFTLSGATAQTSVFFPPGRLASEAYVKHYVDSVLASRATVDVPIVKLPTLPDKPIIVGSLKPCEAGPEIRSITTVTEQGLVLTFHGVKVDGMDFQILKDGATARSGQLEPKSSTLSIGYETLSAGTYTLRLSGNTCLGASTREFTIPRWSGQITPPKVDRPQVDPLPEVPSRGRTSGQSWTYIGRTDTTYLDIVLEETPRGYLITDRTRFNLRDGYEYWYSINNTIVKSAAPLSGYLYASKSGVLSITKHHYTKGLDLSARWHMGPTDNPWYQSNASYVFGSRADVGGQSIILLLSDDAPAGDLAWLDTTPAWYQGDHTFSAPYRAPANSIPSGKMLGYNASVAGISSQLRLSRGETHLSDHTLPIAQRLGRVVGCRVLGITTTTGTRDYYRSIADNMQLDGAAAFETNEGDIWLPHGSTQVRQIMERLTERYEKAGYPYFLSPDYGGYSFMTKPIWDVDQRWKYSATADELRQKDGYFQAFGNSINTANVKNYGTDPRDVGKVTYNRLSQYEIIKRANYKAIGFTWNFMEIFQQGYGPGFAWQHRIDGHNVLVSSLAVLPYEEAVADGFTSMWYGDGLWIWDGQGTRNRDATTLAPGYDPGKTTLNGLTLRTDRDNIEGAFQPEPDAALDGFYVGAVDITSQCRQTEGGERRYLGFTIDGKSYSTEADGSDILTANRENRGICQIRAKGENATVFFLDPYANQEWRDFSVVVNGKTFSGRVFGKRLHVANIVL